MGKEIDLLLLLKKLHDDRPARASSSVLISKLASLADTITISDSSVSASTALYPARWNGTDARWNEFQWWDNKILSAPLYGLPAAAFTSPDAFQHVCSVVGATAGASGWTFDGTDDQITVPDANILDVSSGLTILLAMKKTTTADSIPIRKSNAFNVQINNNSDIYFYLGGAGGWWVPDPVVRITINTDCHLALSYNGTNKAIYINGAVQQTSAQTGNLTATTTDFLIGGIAGYYYAGVLGDIMLYNRGLSATEISAAYTDAKTRMPWLP